MRKHKTKHCCVNHSLLPPPPWNTSYSHFLPEFHYLLHQCTNQLKTSYIPIHLNLELRDFSVNFIPPKKDCLLEYFFLWLYQSHCKQLFWYTARYSVLCKVLGLYWVPDLQTQYSRQKHLPLDYKYWRFLSILQKESFQTTSHHMHFYGTYCRSIQMLTCLSFSLVLQ